MLNTDIIGHGFCRQKNIDTDTDGFIVFGTFKQNDKEVKHVRFYYEDYKIYDNTCDSCKLLKADALIKVKNKDIKDIYLLNYDKATLRNLEYIVTAYRLIHSN